MHDEKFPTWWMSQWLSSAGTWTWWVFLSTVRLKCELSRSSFTRCQCWSSSRLPTETRSWPAEDELTPAAEVRMGNQLCCHDGEFDSCTMTRLMRISLYVLSLLSNCDSFLWHLKKHFKVSILSILLRNTFLTRTNMPAEIIIKCLLFLKAPKPKGKFMFDLLKQKVAATLQDQWNVSSSFQTGNGSLRSPSLIRANTYECWRGGGPTPINDDAAKWQQDIINERPDTNRPKLLDLSLHPLTWWEGTEFLLTEGATTEGVRCSESLIMKDTFFKEVMDGLTDGRTDRNLYVWIKTEEMIAHS